MYTNTLWYRGEDLAYIMSETERHTYYVILLIYSYTLSMADKWISCSEYLHWYDPLRFLKIYVKPPVLQVLPFINNPSQVQVFSQE